MRVFPPALGFAAPGKIQRSGSPFGYENLTIKVLPYDAPLFNQFMSIRDYDDFKRFYERYGLVGFERPLKAAARHSDALKWLEIDRYASPGIADAHLRICWQQLEAYILRAQKAVQLVLGLRDKDPVGFCQSIEKNLQNVKWRFIHTEDGYLLFSHATDYKAACFLQAALAAERDEIGICLRCGRRFIKTKKRVYCGDLCKEQAKDYRRKNDPVEKKKRSLKERLARRDLDSIEKEKVLAAIKRVKRPKDDGETQEALGRLGEIEERWLTRLTPGRQPSSKKAAVKK